MKALSLILSIVAAVAEPCFANAGFVQQKTDSVIGLVASVDQNTKSAIVKADSGTSIEIKTDDNTVCLRIPAGEKTLAKATTSRFAEIAVGDRVLVHGTKTPQGFSAQRLIVLSAAEITKKRQHDLDEWKQRGMGGIVREVNSQTGELTLDLRSPAAPRRLSVNATKARFLRYVAGSLRFEDALPSSFAEIKVGDQLRALGDESPDGHNFVAEEIVSGAFKTVGVMATEVDTQKNEIRATTLDQKKPMVIVLNQDSVLHRISPPVAAAIAQKAKGEASKPIGAPQKNPSSPVIDVQQMIDTLPAISTANIKPGDVLAVTGAVEKDESRLIAIKLAAGVDLVLKALAPPPGKPQVVRLSAGLPSVFDFSVIPIN